MLGSLIKLWFARRRMRKALKRFQQFDVDTLGVKFRRKFSKIYPRWRENFEPKNCYERIFVGGTKENNMFVSLLQFLLLQLFGVIFCFTFAVKFAQRPDKSGIYTGITFGLLAALALYFQGIMKILVIIAWRLLAGKARTLILFLILGLTIEHNLGNATVNIQGLFEGAACTQEEFAVVRQKMAHKAEDAFTLLKDPQMMAAWQEITTGFRSIGGKIREGYRSLQNFADSITRMYQSLSSVTDQCNHYFAGPARKCMDVMHDMYGSCHDWDPLNTGICHGTKNLFLLCDVGTYISDTFCRFPENFKSWVIDGALDAVLETAKKSLKKLSESKWYHWSIYVLDSVAQLPNISIDVYFSNKNTSFVRVASKVTNLIQENIHAEVNPYIAVLRLCTRILNWTLYFIIVIHIMLSIKYIIFYHYRNGSQNWYITKELTEIDRLQKLDGQGTIFPLVGEEKKRYIDLLSTQMTLWESTKRLFYMSITVIYGILPLIFILLDLGIYLICDLIYGTMTNTKLHIPDHYEMKALVDENFGENVTSTMTSLFPVNSTTTEPPDLSDVTTESTKEDVGKKLGSIIARLVHALLDIFSPVNDAISGRDKAWRECFKSPSVPNYDMNWGMMIVWVVAFVLAYWQIWLLRHWLQWAAFFYPRRAHVRALHLYNQILEPRRRTPRQIVPQQTSIFAEAQLHNRDALVRRGLHTQGKTVGSCFKCDRKELHVRDKTNCHLCPGCSCFYCGECYFFAGNCMKCGFSLHRYKGFILHYELDVNDVDEKPKKLTFKSTAGNVSDTAATTNAESIIPTEPKKDLPIEKNQPSRQAPKDSKDRRPHSKAPRKSKNAEKQAKSTGKRAETATSKKLQKTGTEAKKAEQKKRGKSSAETKQHDKKSGKSHYIRMQKKLTTDGGSNDKNSPIPKVLQHNEDLKTPPGSEGS